jgi:hypothetical protein
MLMKSCGGPAFAGRQAERCVFLYACRRLMHTKKYGTAKETEQMFIKVVKPTAKKNNQINLKNISSILFFTFIEINKNKNGKNGRL